ncbi:MAG: prepilin-type N-terminal cleavage/methylation domain-containing protein [Deltaproteobacteria bacterium]|nr:prepilin-type N-terminal cleavage/methylation domain-containing protein [Deltaproteobacteria bacterium]
MLNRRQRMRGFSLIEMLAVLAILAILIGFLAPVLLKSTETARTEATEAEAEKIFKAIVGEPSKANFGYLGDMGRLPATLTELLTQGAQTAFHTADSGVDHVGRVGTGWRGPYLTGLSQEDILKDAWGNDYSYTNTGNNAGQIKSGGADGDLNTASDNIVFPADLPVGTTGTLVVHVLVNDIPQPAGLTVEVYTTDSTGEQVKRAGTDGTQTTAAQGSTPFRFSVPHGVTVVKATHTSAGVTVTRTVNVGVAANTQVEKRIIMKTTATVAM